MSAIIVHDCPTCGQEVEVDYDKIPKRVQCGECKAWADVDYDAEWDGSWKDRTKLISSGV